MTGPGRLTKVQVAAALCMAAVLAAACGSSPSPQAGSGGNGGERVDRLTVAVTRDRGPLNLFAGTATDEELAELVYDKLLAPSPYVEEPQPWLAEQARMLDPSSWEVRLRQGVTWHDGRPFGAHDVVFTFEYFKKAPTGRWTHHVSDVPTIERIEAVDATTVRFTCAFACPDLGRITLADLPIIPKHVWEAVAEPAKATALPVGTGPYRLVSHDATRGYRFEANRAYFAGAPRVSELVMPVIEDPSATFTALRTGEIDAADRPVPPELVDEFRRVGDLQVVATRPLRFPELRMNFERPPFDVADFRRALSLSIDRRAILDTVFLGQGRPGTKGYPHPDSPWTNPALSTPSEPAEGRRLFDRLGLADRDGNGTRERSDGSPMRFSIKVAGSEPTHLRAAELVAEQLAKVGLDVVVQPLDAGVIAGLFRSRDFDMSLDEITAHGVADPTQFIMSHRSGYLWKAPALAYPEWDALFERWKHTTTVQDRTAVLFEMQQLFNRQPTSIPLAYPDEHWAFRPEAFAGWVETPGYGIVHKWSLLPAEVARRANAVRPSVG